VTVPRIVYFSFSDGGRLPSISWICFRRTVFHPSSPPAAGRICAGFTGVGGREFARPENGFWVPEDDCIAAADALADAADLVRAGGPALNRRREAGYETARQWVLCRLP
jgi:hypothetical protein